MPGIYTGQPQDTLVYVKKWVIPETHLVCYCAGIQESIRSTVFEVVKKVVFPCPFRVQLLGTLLTILIL